MRLPPVAGVLIFVLHAAAIITNAVPEPTRLAEITGERESSDNVLSSRLRPLLDPVVPSLERANGFVWRATRPVRRLLGPLVASFRISQSWRMFAEPPRTNSTIAVCVARLASHETRCEIVSPAIPPQQFKGIAAYQPSYRDKALSNALLAELRARREKPEAFGQVRTRFGVDVLRPIGRFLGPSRPGPGPYWTEVWYGRTPMAPRGEVRQIFPDLPNWPHVNLPSGRAPGEIANAGDTRWTLLRAGYL